MSLSWWDSDAFFIPKSQSTLDGQLQGHYQGRLAIKCAWLHYAGWRWEITGLKSQASWSECVWPRHMQIDSVWWERMLQKGRLCYSDAGGFSVLLFSSVPKGNWCGTCIKPDGSAWELPAPLAAAALPSRLSVSERCQGQGHFAASNGWVVGDTILLDRTWFPKAVFPLSGDFWKERSRTPYWKFIPLISACHPKICSVCTL